MSAATVLVQRGDGTLLRLRASIADTPQARTRGFSGVSHLDPSAAMVFEFPAITYSAFWMKGTRVPLDIAFWNRSGVILSVQQMQPCAHDPCQLYEAPSPYIACVEVAAGVLERAGVRAGDRVSLAV